MVDPLAGLLIVRDALEQLGVRYFVGGSLASLVHGVPRTTIAADVIADLRAEHVEPLVEALGGAFYVEASMIREAIARRSSFNVIHYQTGFKIDVFVPKQRPFDASQLERRVERALDDNPAHRVFVASPEDIILAKLEWYRLGREVSDRQWADLIGVIRAQGDRLDLDYLRHWAAQLGTGDLLDRALYG